MDGITVRMSENRHIRIQIQNYDKFQLQSGKTESPHPRTHHKICERHKICGIETNASNSVSISIIWLG